MLARAGAKHGGAHGPGYEFELQRHKLNKKLDAHLTNVCSRFSFATRSASSHVGLFALIVVDVAHKLRLWL